MTKRLSCAFLLGLLAVASAFAAESWRWKILDSDFLSPAGPAEFNDVWGSSSSDVWVVGELSQVLHSDGYTWDRVEVVGGQRSLTGVGGSGPDDVYIVGDDGQVYHWDGIDWSTEHPGTTLDITAVWVVPSGDVFAGATAGTMVHKINGQWGTFPLPQAAHVIQIWGSSATNVFAATAWNGLFHWDGTVWTKAHAEGRWVCGFGADDVYTKELGPIYHWDGSSWTTTGAANGILGCDPTGRFVFVGVGDDRTVRRRTSTTTTTVGSFYTDMNALWVDEEGRAYFAGRLSHLYRLDPDNELHALSRPEALLDRPFRTAEGELLSSGSFGAAPSAERGILDYHDGIARYEEGEWILEDGTEGLRHIWLDDQGDGWAAGIQGKISHRENGQWIPESSGSPSDFNAILGLDDGRVLATTNQVILERDNGQWSVQQSGDGYCDLWAAAPDDIYADSCFNDGSWHNDGNGWTFTAATGDIELIWGRGTDDVTMVTSTGGIYRYDGLDWTYKYFDDRRPWEPQFMWGAPTGENLLRNSYQTWFEDGGEWSYIDGPTAYRSPLLAWTESGNTHRSVDGYGRFHELGCPSLPGGAWWSGPQLDTFADIEIDGPMVYAAGTLGSFSAFGGNDGYIVAWRRGEVLWNKPFGGSREDRIYDLEPTADGGVIAVGRQQLANGDHQAWAIKLDRDGNREWAKLFGSAGFDSLNAVRQRIDGRFVAVGETPGTDGEPDAWVLELAADGTVEKSTTFGGPGEDVLTDLQIKSWGGLVAVGRTSSGPYGQLDGWLLSFGHSADTLYFQRFYGGGIDDGLEAIAATPDGWAIAGWAQSFGNGISKGWIVGLEPTFGRRFSRAYGGLGDDRFLDIDVDSEGRLVTAGRTTSFGNARQAWLQVADPNGDRLYAELHGGAGDDDFQAVAIGCARDSITAVGASTTNGVGGSRDAWAKTPDHSQAKAWIGQFRNFLQSRGLSGELITITTDPQEDPSFDRIRYLEGTAYLRPLDSFDELYQAAADIIARARPSADADSDGTANATDLDPFDSAVQ